MRYRTIIERERQAAARADARTKQNQHVRYMKADKYMRDYEEAYKALYGEPITLTEKRGFITIGKKLYRYNLLPGLTAKLWAQVQERDNGGAD